MRKRRPTTPLGLSLRVGDLVMLKQRRGKGIRAKKMGESAAKGRGHLIWTIVGFVFVYGRTHKVRAVSGRGKNRLEMVCDVSELASLSDARPECRIIRHAGGRPSVACWDVEHPYWGPMLAVRFPYDAAAVEKFKALVREDYRRWDSKRRIWYVDRSRRPVVDAFLRRYFPDGKMPPTGGGPARSAVDAAKGERGEVDTQA